MTDIGQDFFVFLRTMPWQEISVSSGCLMAGAFAHWMKKAAAREVPWNLYRYCFKQHFGRTVMLAGALVAAEWALVTASTSYATWPPFMTASFMAGWVANSAFNKGKPPEKPDVRNPD